MEFFAKESIRSGEIAFLADDTPDNERAEFSVIKTCIFDGSPDERFAWIDRRKCRFAQRPAVIRN